MAQLTTLTIAVRFRYWHPKGRPLLRHERRRLLKARAMTKPIYTGYQPDNAPDPLTLTPPSGGSMGQ